MKTYHSFALLLIIMLTACSSTPSVDVESYYFRQGIPSPTTMSFTHCYGYGCKHKVSITLNDEDWEEIYALFEPRAENAEQERKQIRQAIAQFEKTVGPIAGTDGDIRGSFLKLGKLQHDCVDESINTTTYMSLLQDSGFIRYHQVWTPSHRMLRNGLPGWPHQTATLIEKESGNKFVVDSWFRDNGYPPFIVTLKTWRFGWQPKKAMLPEVYANK